MRTVTLPRSGFKRRGISYLLRLAAVVGALLFILHPSSFILAHDWPTWRGPEQTGVSREVDLPASFSIDPKDPKSNLIWTAPYACRSTPIVMNGRVYINNAAGEGINEQERVMCLDANTGTKIWEKRLNIWNTDIVSVRLGWGNLVGDPKTGNIYVHGTQGVFVCFDKDGKILWQRYLTEEAGRISGYGGRVTSPTVDEDLVIIGLINFSWGDQTKSGNRYLAMNKHTGQMVWWWTSPHPPLGVFDTYYSNPVVAVINGQRVLITGGGDGYLHAVKVRTGEYLWSYPLTKGSVNCSPVVDGSLVYITHGSENVDDNVQGGIFCVDASQVKDKQPKLVWKKYGISAHYASPLIHDGKLYVCSDIARLYCLDAKTGDSAWRKPLIYGRNTKGSPVWADGRIYTAAVNSTFSIIKPGATKGEVLHEEQFPAVGGAPVELNGTPAVANGRIYFGTSEAMYCIGKKGHTAKAKPIPSMPKESTDTKPTQVRIEPVEVTLYPGENAKFVVKALDANGRVVKTTGFNGDWSAPVPPKPFSPPVKTDPPALKAKLATFGGPLCSVTVDAKVPEQAGLVQFKTKLGTATARVRVVPRLPYEQNFDKIANGYAPASWMNAQGKFFVVTLPDGNKVLRNNVKVAASPVARSIAFIGPPNQNNYTIQADVMCTQVDTVNDQGEKKSTLPDVGLVANGYRLVWWGNLGQLKIDSWDAIPRVSTTASAVLKPKVWFRMKYKVQSEGTKAHLYGKVWQRDQPEPKDWTIEFTDPNPNPVGCPGLYRYTAVVGGDGPSTDVYFDNVKITPNKK